MKFFEIINYLFNRYKKDKEFANFINDTDLINKILQAFRKKKLNFKSIPTDIEIPKIEYSGDEVEYSENKMENKISNSDGFSKIIFESLKIKRVLSEDNVAQEHLLSKKDIRECFSYLSNNFNNVQLHQGKIWVLEYTGGL